MQSLSFATCVCVCVFLCVCGLLVYRKVVGPLCLNHGCKHGDGVKMHFIALMSEYREF